MNSRILSVSVSGFALFVSLQFAVGQTADRKVVGYFVSWGVYARDYHVQDIPAEYLTHINYAFAKPVFISEGSAGIMLGDPYADIDKFYPGDTWDPGALRGNFNQLLKLKAQYPDLKTLISIGGWTWSAEFSDIAAYEGSRRAFAASCAEFVEKYGFDGVDLDWEYPVAGGLAGNGHRPDDDLNFLFLLQAIRDELNVLESQNGREYLLSIATVAAYNKFDIQLMVPETCQVVDWINIMTYDFSGPWDSVTGHNAPLYANPSAPYQGYNVDTTINAYLAAGASPEKLSLGCAFYGRGFGGVPSTQNGLFQYTSGASVRGSWESGMFDFKDLRNGTSGNQFIDAGGFTRYWDDSACVPWLYNPASGVFISYDDEQSLAMKGDYAADAGLGGVMIWELDCDTEDNLLISSLYDHFVNGTQSGGGTGGGQQTGTNTSGQVTNSVPGNDVLALDSLPLQLEVREGETVEFVFDGSIDVVHSRNPDVADILVDGTRILVTGLESGRSGLTLESEGVRHRTGLRVDTESGEKPGLPDYLAVGSVSEDTAADLAFWHETGEGLTGRRMDLRYIYLCGGPINGWRTWGEDRAGDFARNSLRMGMIPVFVFYNIPDGGESYWTDLSHLRDSAYMQAYYANLDFFLERMRTVMNGDLYCVILEPDLLGYMQQNSGMRPAEISTVDGTLTDTVKRINGTIAENGGNVMFGWQLNLWARNGVNGAQGLIRRTDMNDYEQLGWDAGRELIRESAVMIADYAIEAGVLSHGAGFLVVDKYGLDGGYSSPDNPSASTWFWNMDHWNNYLLFMRTIRETAGVPVALWQIPVGHINSSLETSALTGVGFPDLSNTHTHYEDSACTFFLGDLFDPGSETRVEYFAENRSGDEGLHVNGETISWAPHMEAAMDAGVEMILFGAGVGASTDGVGSPPTDDGFWIQKVQRYYMGGCVSLEPFVPSGTNGSSSGGTGGSSGGGTTGGGSSGGTTAVSLDPIACWLMDEGEGSVTLDAVEQRNGTLSGNALWSDSRPACVTNGYSLLLQESAWVMAIRFSGPLAFAEQGSIGFWLNPRAEQGYVFDCLAGERTFMYRDSRGWPIYLKGRNVGVLPPNRIPGNAWTHVTIVWDQAAGSISVHTAGAGNANACEDSWEWHECSDSAVTEFQVGAGFAGGIDEFAVWDRALTTEEIHQLALAGLACEARSGSTGGTSTNEPGSGTSTNEPVVTPAPTPVSSSSNVVCWSFNQGTGTEFTDDDRVRTGSLTAYGQWSGESAFGVEDRSLRFSGEGWNSGAVLEGGTSFGTEGTVSFWMMPDLNWGYVFDTVGASRSTVYWNGHGWPVYLNGSHVGTIPPDAVPVNEWTCVVLTWDASGVRAYARFIEQVEPGAWDWSVPVVGGADICQFHLGAGYKGCIDMFRTWDHALSDAEARNLLGW